MKSNSIEIFQFLTKTYTQLKSILRKTLKISLTNLKSIWINQTKSVENSTSMININNKDHQLISEIEHSLHEIEIARNIFNNVDEANLIETAIYLEEAAIKRFDYLIRIAKKKCVTVSNEYIASKFLEFTK